MLTAIPGVELPHELWVTVNPELPNGSETHFRAEEGNLALT